MVLTGRDILDGQQITINRGPAMATVIYIFHGIAAVVCIARFLTRGLMLRAFGNDDYMMMITLVLSTCVTATVPLQVSSGAGAHASELRKDQISSIQKMAWLSQVFYLPTLLALKLSILGLYTRITIARKHKITLIVIAVVLTGHTISTTITNIFLCKPQRIIWDVDVFPQGCIRVLEFNYFNAAFHIFTDVILVALPFPLLGSLHISRRKRIGLAAVFSLGLVACALTVTRVVYVVRWAYSPDFPWSWMPVALFTNLELSVGMIMACMPALNILVKKVFKLGSTVDNSNSYELKESTGNGLSGAVKSKSKGGASMGYNTRIMATENNGSEEGIIQQGKYSLERSTSDGRTEEYSGPPGHRIVQTQEVQIEWSSSHV